MTPEWRLVMVLWIISSIGIVGLVTVLTIPGTAEKPQYIQKTVKAR